MPRLQVYRGNHYRRERGRIVEYRRGDIFEGSENEARNMKDKLRVVGPAQVRTVDSGGGDDSGQGGGKPIETDDDGNTTDELTVKQLRKMADDLDITIPSDVTRKDDIRKFIDEAIASM